MNIFKITIATLIISQSAFAGYGKAIVGGAVGGVAAAVVTNAVSKNTPSEQGKSSGGSLVVKCYCEYELLIDRTSSETIVKCYTGKNRTGLRVLLYGGSNNITVIPNAHYDSYGCQVSK